jgi:predicted Zn-dependent protease
MPPGGRRLYLAPLGEVKRVSLEELARYYRSWLGHAVHLLPPVTPTGSLVDHARQQVIAEAAVEAVRWRVGDLGVDPSAIVIAITDEDMYIRHSSRRSAFSYRGDERFAVVSAARMAPVAYEYRGKEYLFHSRLRKIVGNNIGLLLYRFPTSLDPTSLLYEKILSVADLDTMRNDFQELGVRAAAVDFPVSHRQPPIEAEITHDRLAGLDLTPGNIERTRRLLQDWWGVADRHSLLASLKWIEESGHRARFALWGAWLAVLAPDERKALASRRQKDFELHQTLGVVETHHQRLGSKSLVGWDFSRHINVCRWGYAAGYLSEAEAWAKIAPAARTLRHTFTSWRELGENYLIGRQFWSPEEHFRSGNLFRMAFDRLLSDPHSPWNRVPWDLDLGPPPIGPGRP